MDCRTLLILTFHFPPSAASGSFRLLGFARHLPKFGWRSVVVAPPGLPWEPQDDDLAKQIPPETLVRRVPYFTGRLSAPLRMGTFAPWLLRAWPSCLHAVRRHHPAAILTSGPPHQIHVLGLLLKRWYGIPWVADFRDPWVACTPRAFDKSLRARWEAKQERAIMRRADVIVANAPLACAALQDAYPNASARIVAITNGFDPERFAVLTACHSASSDKALTILHPGVVYAGRDPSAFLDALGELLPDASGSGRPIRVQFLGRLDNHRGPSLLETAIRSRGMESVVSIADHVPYVQALEQMARSDILLLLDSPGRRIGVPAKLYEYLGAGRPVLALAEPESDTTWVLRESGIAHRIARPNDRLAIKQALSELIDEYDTGWDGGLSAGATHTFTRESLASQLAAILDGSTTGSALEPDTKGCQLGAVSLPVGHRLGRRSTGG
jgi:glycosyltransferase involved in cell wall biosynthesis